MIVNKEQTMKIDTNKARLYFSDGRIKEYEDQTLAYEIWLVLPKGTRVAFRGKGDKSPVYSWDLVDKLPG